VLDVLNHSTARYVARAQFASGEGTDDERKVRVYVRALPKTAAVAAAEAPAQQLLGAARFAPDLQVFHPVQPALPTPGSLTVTAK
jgi:hypothetical protein